MTTFQETKRKLTDACWPLLQPRGFKCVKSRNSFERPTATGRLSIRLLFTSSDVGNDSVRIGCGVRHDAIEKIVHQTSTVDKRAQSSSTTIEAGWSDSFYLNNREEQESALCQLHAYIQEVALPFLEREYSLVDISSILNVTDAEERPVYRAGMGTSFWQRGLAAAKLAGDPRFQDLKRHYTAHVRTLSNGFYFPAFDACLKFIDGSVSFDPERSAPDGAPASLTHFDHSLKQWNDNGPSRK